MAEGTEWGSGRPVQEKDRYKRRQNCGQSMCSGGGLPSKVQHDKCKTGRAESAMKEATWRGVRPDWNRPEGSETGEHTFCSF